MLRLLAELARSGTRNANPTTIDADVDSWRRRISQKVEDVQSLIESSKFESGDLQIDAIQKFTADSQPVFVLLLSLTRHTGETAQPSAVRTAAVELEASRRDPYRQLSRVFHLIGRKSPS